MQPSVPPPKLAFTTEVFSRRASHFTVFQDSEGRRLWPLRLLASSRLYVQYNMADIAVAKAVKETDLYDGIHECSPE